MKEMVVDFRKKSPLTRVSRECRESIQGRDVETGLLEVPQCSLKQKTELDHNHRSPVQERPESTPPAEETEVFWSMQDLVKVLL